MKATPAFILRNCVLWADNDVKAGQTSDIGLNMPKEKTEKIRNGGMVKDRSIAMGYELEDLEFSLFKWWCNLVLNNLNPGFVSNHFITFFNSTNAANI